MRMLLVRWIWLFSLFLTSTFVRPTIGLAYPENYPPFPSDEPALYPALKADLILDYGAKSPFEEGPVRISNIPYWGKKGMVTEVRVKGRRIFNTHTAHSDIVLIPLGGRVFYTDLTGDGLKDILIYTWLGGVGLGSYDEMADLLIAQAGGSFKHITFETFAAGPEDFIDVNKDGHYEMLWVGLDIEGGHSYWVYRVVEIGEHDLRLNDALIPGFPKIIWYTKKPNDKPTQRLTAAEREELIQDSTASWLANYH